MLHYFDIKIKRTFKLPIPSIPSVVFITMDLMFYYVMHNSSYRNVQCRNCLLADTVQYRVTILGLTFVKL